MNHLVMSVAEPDDRLRRRPEPVASGHTLRTPATLRVRRAVYR
jgi:hypothetical protein